MQNTKKISQYLNVSLHGMDDRAQKMMVNYLKMCCQDFVKVVGENEAQAEIVDVDLAHSKTLLEERLEQQPPKPVIALSVQEVLFDDVIYVKKPIAIPDIKEAIKTAKNTLLSHAKKAKLNKVTEGAVSQPVKPAEKKPEPEIKQTKTPAKAPVETPAKSKSTVQQKNEAERKKEMAKVIKSISAAKRGKSPKDPITSKATKPSASKKPKQEKTVEDKASTEVTKPVVSKGSLEPVDEEVSSVHLREIDRLLKEIHDVSAKPSSSKKESDSESKQKNNRKSVRYAFHPIEAKLKKNALIGGHSNLTVLVLNVSSKGGIIELKKPAKLQGKVTLSIYFDSQNSFVIPARVIRKETKSIYGLQFLSHQHELTDFLVNSGRSFFFT